MTKPACGSCRFWTKTGGNVDTSTFGDCHRYPPSLRVRDDNGDLQAAHPETWDYDWCGEFADSEPPKWFVPLKS